MQIHRIRQKFITILQEKFKEFDFNYSIGGQISFDVSIRGWNKSNCLKFLNEYQKIYFFGDKTEKVRNKLFLKKNFNKKGGNDFEIFNHERTIGYTVKNVDDTIVQIDKLFINKL